MDLVYLGVGGGVALSLMMLGWFVSARRSIEKSSAALLPSDAKVGRKSVLSDAEATLYNLLRLTVQDRYLVLAHIPLWCLLDIQSCESRRPLLSHLALKRATFVLLHPGTRQAEKVVVLQEDSNSEFKQARNDRLLEVLLSSAGIQLVRLTSQETYTAPMLAELLDTAEAD